MLRTILATLAVLLALARPAAAQSDAEWQQVVEAAKKEGKIVLYTATLGSLALKAVIQAFEAKYGIKVSFTRGDSQVNSIKLLNEYRAGRVMADVFGLTSNMEVLIDAGVVRQFTAANAEEFPPQYRDPERYWVSSHLFVLTPGINTSLVPAAQRPKSYDDLLLPHWKGRMAWKMNDLSGGPGFVGNVLTHMGEERGMAYLRRLARQDIKVLNASARAILDQVIAGEYPMALQIFNHHAAISADKGAPVDWVRLSPATVTPGLVGLPKNAPHPNAGLLFVEFMTSKEGQQIFQKAAYLPARPDTPPTIPALVPASGGFGATVITPELTAKSMNHWDKVFAELFR